MLDGCCDMILADLPYGTTACKWDTVIPFEPMWKEFHRIAKPNAAIVLTASQPFTSALVMSNVKNFKYEWVWDKVKPTGFLYAKKRPMSCHESVLIFSRKPHSYFPQGLTYSPKMIKRTGGTAMRQHGKESLREFTGYPSTKINFGPCKEKGIHPTQKPVALFEYLIKTYTQPGELVFDPTAGSLTTGVAAENLSRRWVCCEQLEEYYEKGIARFTP